MQNYVAILAAGKGSRTGMDEPKQFVMLEGKSLFEHSLDTFEQHPCIHGIILVANPDYLEKTKTLAYQKNRSKIIAVVSGGKERFNSSMAAIQTLDFADDTDNLLIHDAARPFVSSDLISRTLEALNIHCAVSVAIPSPDTSYICEDGIIICSPDRNQVYLAQTPQAAQLGVFRKAFALAEKELTPMTDDANVILDQLPEIPVHVIPGDIKNKKITYLDDLKHNV